MPQSRDNAPDVPKGWKAVFDDEYKTWFYVNLATNQSQWEPPKGTSFPNSQKAQRPSGPPQNCQSSTPQQRQQQYPQQQQYGPQRSYGAAPMGYGTPSYGAAGYGAPSMGYGQAAPAMGYGARPMMQPTYVQAPQQQQSHGMRNGLIGAGAGVLGGLLLGDVIHHDEDRAYDQGFDNGYGDGFDQGDFDGGGFDDGGF
ncbi:uncharacterized protein ZBIST_2578 [Zygosaccharomyces bailii]|nr:uncharacterized protein ZBIST_2578 [Zygosaccharomyces bailii]